jgi:hypothetical protein
MTSAWRKSSFSGVGECVEATFTNSGGVLVRDSKDPDGLVLACTGDEWRSFVAGVKAGDLD